MPNPGGFEFASGFGSSAGNSLCDLEQSPPLWGAEGGGGELPRPEKARVGQGNPEVLFTSIILLLVLLEVYLPLPPFLSNF